MTTLKDIKQTIVDSLELNTSEVVSESYVASPKQFDITTELLSQKTKSSHMKLYHGYVEKLNRASAQLDTADRASASPTSSYRAIKQAEIYNKNAVYLHELYFANISDVRSEIAYDSLTFMRLARDFGSFDDWQWDFIACALSSHNGWAVTAFDVQLQRFINFFIDGHECNIPIGCYPVIVLDCNEHAYFRDYLDSRDKYITNMMKEFKWSIIEKRIERADAIAKVIRT